MRVARRRDPTDTCVTLTLLLLLVPLEKEESSKSNKCEAKERSNDGTGDPSFAALLASIHRV